MWLDPDDPMFKKLSDSYLEYQKEYFNIEPTFYALDMFNEVTPSSTDLGRDKMYTKMLAMENGHKTI